MAADDYAVLAGINRYPGLGDLGGPENDVDAFKAWLLKKDGGDVLPEHITIVKSSDFPAAANTFQAQPSLEKLQQAFAELRTKGDPPNGGHVGRRLYVYLAGHGFVPDSNRHEVALYMANAEKDREGYNLGGPMWADWFVTARYFDEVLLFMDCCRPFKAKVPVSLMPWRPVVQVPPARYAYMFSAEVGSTSREAKMNGGKLRGLFSAVLLEGLTGAAPRDDAGQLTTETLKDWLRSNLPARATGLELESQTPEFDAPKEKMIVFLTVAPTQFHLKVTLSPAHAGKNVTVVDGDLTAVAATQTTTTTWEWDLKAGLYKIDVAGGPSLQIEVPKGPLDVTF